MHNYLLPCALCGCTKCPIRQGNGIGDYWLECVECGMSTRLREDGDGIADWNRRPTTTEIVEAQSVRDAASVPPDVMAALNRMCSPLHESRLTGVTAQEDARCMKLIRDYVLSGNSVRDAWISVDERLPEEDQTVLATNGKWIGVAQYMRDEYLEDIERWQDENREFIEHLGPAVTHWQPLPAPPQKPVSDEVMP